MLAVKINDLSYTKKIFLTYRKKAIKIKNINSQTNMRKTEKYKKTKNKAQQIIFYYLKIRFMSSLAKKNHCIVKIVK